MEGLQRVGVALSDDLEHWTRYGDKPVLDADPRWYEARVLDSSQPGVAWRDPCIVRDEGGSFHAFLCARSASGPWAGRGAIAHAVSRDLLRWEVGPPLHVSDHYGFLEVPDVFRLEGRWFLVFSTAEWHGVRRAGEECLGASGIRYLVADRLEGPWREPARNLLLGSREGTLSAFAGRTIALGGDAQRRVFYYHNVFPASLDDFTALRGSLAAPKRVVASGECLSLVYLPGLETSRAAAGPPRSLAPWRWLQSGAGPMPAYPGTLGTGVTWEPAGEGILGRCAAGTAALWTSPPDGPDTSVPADGIWTVRVHLGSAKGAGLGVRFDPKDGRGVALFLDAATGRAGLVRTLRGEFGMKVTTEYLVPHPVSDDADHLLRLVARGPFVDAYVDERLVASHALLGPSGAHEVLLVEDGSARFERLTRQPLRPV